MLTLDRARVISDACAQHTPPAARPLAEYRRPDYRDPNDMPAVHEFTGIEALTEWANSGGDLRVFSRGQP